MYRVSPFTYLVSAVLSTGLAQTNVVCAANEILRLSPPAGQTCAEFLGPYMHFAGGQLLNPSSTTQCEFCSVATTDTFLAQLNIYYIDRWRNVGILFAYVGFNVVGAIFLYWLARVPKRKTLKEN